MLILLSAAASPAASKVATFVREAFAATPLGIVIQALGAKGGSRTPRSADVDALRVPR